MLRAVKPSQTPGTLPTLKVTKSFLRRDAISKSQNLSPQQRETLLEVLCGLLNEEHELAKESELYQRTPSLSADQISHSISCTGTRQTSNNLYKIAEDSLAIGLEAVSTRYPSRMPPPQPSSLKKREASQSTGVVSVQPISVPSKQTDGLQNSKRAKTITKTAPLSRPPSRQQSLDNMFARADPSSVESTSVNQTSFDQTTQVDPLIRSFTTNASEEPDRVFSDNGLSTPSSNATSFMSVDDNDESYLAPSTGDTQFSGGTQIDQDYLDDIEAQRSFHAAENGASHSTSNSLLNDLYTNSPFKPRQCRLPLDLSYWYTFELYRISDSFGIDVKDLYKRLIRDHEKKQLPFDDLWQGAKALVQESKTSGNTTTMLPIKSSIPNCALQQDLYYDPISTSSVSFTGKLDFCENAGSLFVFKLNPITYEKSCRFHRQFGADRFLAIDMPYFDSRSLPKHLAEMLKAQGDLAKLHDSVFRWLTTTDLHIAGRKWRAFYTEPIKSRSKKKRREENPRQRLHLFAVDGFDFKHAAGDNPDSKSPMQPSQQSSQHDPMSVLEFINWHIRLDKNAYSTDMKLFARIQLGLSKTLPTIVLEPHEFIEAPDVLAQNADGTDVTDGTIMTDGCARISFQLARAVWNCYDKPGEDVPSAFQARIGGAKGLWQVDYTNAHPEVSERGFWIEIRDSQLKIKPQPAKWKSADESQRTFEVVKHSTTCTPAHLNIQLINILNYCGVPRTALGEVLNADLAEYLDTLKSAMHDPLKLRIWHQMNHRAPNDSIDFCGAMPGSKEDELSYLLESGFQPATSEYLTDCLKNLLKEELNSYVDKLRIRVEHSTAVFCVPDPLGILAPGEIQLNFSASKIDPWSNVPESFLVAPQILVARNPAHLASDIQLVKSAYHHELRHLKDVIIFPVKGRYPLADLLSGGDYDGDTVTVIWDPKLTYAFRNHDKPTLPKKSDCGVKSQTRLICDVFANVMQPTEQQLDDFLRHCCSLNGMRSLLGDVTVEHEALIYADSQNLGVPQAEILAALAGYLVDSAKQGDSFGLKAWQKLKQRGRKECGFRGDVKPAYKQATKVRVKRDNVDKCVNIIDHLKFDVAGGLRDETLTDFHSNWGSKQIQLDSELTRVYDNEEKRSQDSTCVEKGPVEKVLRDLYGQIDAIRREWLGRMRNCGRHDDDMPGAQYRNKPAAEEYASIVRDLADRTRAIAPLQVDCDIRRDFEREGGAKGTRWSFLKASRLYYRYPHGAMAWKLVGDELCMMKARACGRTWEMTLGARQIMKADVKRYRRLNEDADGADGDDTQEEFYDAEK